MPDRRIELQKLEIDKRAVLGPGETAGPAARVRVAGVTLCHTPWFAGRAADGEPGERRVLRASAAAIGGPGDLSAILQMLCRDALAASVPNGPIGTFRLLADPLLTSLRVALFGGIRDGFRGILLASLHGLHRLIVLARGWQAWEARTSADATGAER